MCRRVKVNTHAGHSVIMRWRSRKGEWLIFTRFFQQFFGSQRIGFGLAKSLSEFVLIQISRGNILQPVYKLIQFRFAKLETAVGSWLQSWCYQLLQFLGLLELLLEDTQTTHDKDFRKLVTAAQQNRVLTYSHVPGDLTIFFHELL